MAERKIFNHHSEILVTHTIQTEGYDPTQFGPTSNKFIWASCRFCGQPSRLRKGQFIKSGSACHKECRFKEQSISGSPFADESVKEKSRQTHLERYGSEHANQNKDVAAKISAARLSKENQDKIKNTNLQKYGVENPFQSEEIKNKIRQTNLARFGHVHPRQNPIIVKQSVQKFKANYASQNPNSIVTVLRGDDFWIDLKKETLFDTCQKYQIDYKDTTSMISREEFRDKYYSTYTFPKTQKQNEVQQEVENLGLQTVRDESRIIAPLEIDVFVPSRNFAIEFNGNLWHSEAFLLPSLAKYKHLEKTRRCSHKGIKLFHIFEHQWRDRKHQVLNLIKSQLELNSTKIHARKCKINNDPCETFIDDNHIQGHGNRTIKYFNLVYGDEIVASMTASEHHRQNADKGVVILNRLCFKDGVSIRGGSSKLFKQFVIWAQQEGYSTIVSWSDNCWTTGRIYEVLGFVLEQEYGPDYFYWDIKRHKVISKQSQQKKKTGCPEHLTEREWCIQRGLYRIWDCGKKKWVYPLSKSVETNLD